MLNFNKGDYLLGRDFDDNNDLREPPIAASITLNVHQDVRTLPRVTGRANIARQHPDS